jgi:DNA invertase Pin-like site-specific DNA recombinase
VNREELRTVLDFLRKEDVLVVTRFDRLPRGIGELQDIVRTVRGKGASLKATGQPIDTSTAAGKCFLDMLGVCAQFETNLRPHRYGCARSRPARAPQGRHIQASILPPGRRNARCSLDLVRRRLGGDFAGHHSRNNSISPQMESPIPGASCSAILDNPK